MFKTFSIDQDVIGVTPCKQSAQRALTQRVAAQFPDMAESVLEAALPKKEQIALVKCKNNITLIVSPVLKYPVFFQIRDGPLYPTLRFLHAAAEVAAVPRLQIDSGGIKFILKGADVFCAGITSKGGDIPQPLPADAPVQITAQGKEHALAVGLTKLSTAEILSVNTGAGVETLHFLGDDLWKASFVPPRPGKEWGVA